MARLAEHEHICDSCCRAGVRILDCAGTGVGGAALAKTLTDQGCNVDYTLPIPGRRLWRPARSSAETYRVEAQGTRGRHS
ncbi:MAG TPA: hypothetical protein EYP33_01935 [Pyrodictium sp.]|nr:hypothetical protein [Pyrodictium sp.]